MGQISWFSHWCIVELLIVHPIGNGYHIWFSKCVVHMLAECWIECRPSFPSRTHAFSSRLSTLNRFPLLSQQLYGSSMVGCPLESLSHVFDWSVKILSFCFWSIYVIFTSHHLEIMLEFALNHFSLMSLRWIRIHWLSSFPIISTQCKDD